jgi:D-glycero-alpha-D-manno-heptose 1-phosphate guanylyltransferase
MVKTAIILAGGFGTRLRSVVSNVPKPMAPIDGKPFLQYQLDYLINQGISTIHLAVGYKHEIVSQYFGKHFRGASLIYSVEHQPLGTGGALINVLRSIKNDGPLIIVNGDTYFPIDIMKFGSLCESNSADWGIALFRSADLDRYTGVVLGANGSVISLKHRKKNQTSLVNGGIYWLNPKTGFNQAYLKTFQENSIISLEDQLLPSAISLKQRIFGYEMDNVFIDIGVPEDYHRATKIINSKI